MMTGCLGQDNLKFFKVFFIVSKVCCLSGVLLIFRPAQLEAQITGGLTQNTQTIVDLSGNTFEITGGLPKGNNLFHSFNRFSIRAGEIVKFSNDTGKNISNILSRVTGGTRSLIEGRVQVNKASGFEKTNFFLMNSAGVTLGSGAVFDIEGSVHITTADILGSKDGVLKFYADPAMESMLTASSIETFGFLNKAASIDVVGAELETTEGGTTLSLVGGNITITNDSLLKAGSGRIIIVSVASKGNVYFVDNQVEDLSNIDELGTIRIDQSTIDVSATDNKGHGVINIRGGKFFLENSSSLNATNNSRFAGEQTAINIEVRDGIKLIKDATIATNTSGDAFSDDFKPDAGNIKITANGALQLVDNSKIQSLSDRSGKAGDIDLDVKQLSLSNQSEVNSSTVGALKRILPPGLVLPPGQTLPQPVLSGSGGNIYVKAKNNVTISNNSRLTTSTANVAGSAGKIEIRTPAIKVDGGTIQATSAGEGNAGDIVFAVDNMTLREGGVIINRISSSGAGGKITIRGFNGITSPVGMIDISGNSSRINSETRGSSDGGVIDLKVNVIRLSEGASISSESTGSATGNAGKIILSDVNQLTVSGGAQISSASSTIGSAGEISITGKGKVTLSNLGLISSKSESLGNAGNISFKISELQLDNSNITTEAIQADGGNITIEGNSPSKLVSLNNDSAITATVGGGAQTTGGNINIDSDLIVAQNSNIIAEASEGVGGNIDIKTQGLFVDPESRISASSQLGVDGTVEIDSDIQVLDGVLGLPETYVSNLRLRQKRCAQRLSGGKSSSLTTVEKSGMAMGPETLVSGDYSTYFKNETQLGKAPQNIKNLALLDEQYDFNCRN